MPALGSTADLNTPAIWERMRWQDDPFKNSPGLDYPMHEVIPQSPLIGFRFFKIIEMIQWCCAQQGVSPAVLDIGAGSGLLGRLLREKHPDVLYHATEQSPKLCAAVQESAPKAAVALWRCGDGSLYEALAQSTAQFLPAYPVVLLNSVMEHVEDDYSLLDEAYSLTAGGGFILAVVPRNDFHRLYFHRYDWDEFIAKLNNYRARDWPLAVWEYDFYTDLFAAARRAPLVPSENGPAGGGS